MKQEIWYNQYSVEEYEQESKENKLTDFYTQHNKTTPENSTNSFSNATIKETNVFVNEQTKNGSMIVERRRIKSQFWQTLDLKNFPCDVQVIIRLRRQVRARFYDVKIMIS